MRLAMSRQALVHASGVLVIGLSSLLVVFHPFDSPGAYALAFNLILLAAVLWGVGLGIWTHQEPLINLSLLFFALQVMARYFDFFFSLFDRSLVFIGAGALFSSAAGSPSVRVVCSSRDAHGNGRGRCLTRLGDRSSSPPCFRSSRSLRFRVRELMIQTGREYVLDTRPVDPRDIFRGDYVALRYEISSLNYCCYQVGDTIYVTLEERDGVWHASGHEHEPPSDAQPFIRGQVGRIPAGSGRPIDVEYGIESYFVPEEPARHEARIRQANGQVRVRVHGPPSGTAVIKELVVE